MINNAGLMPHSPLERRKVDDWDQMIDVHLKGVLYGIAAALPYMKEQKAGHFINVSSVAGHKVRPGGVVYAATKHAVRVLDGRAAHGGQARQHPHDGDLTGRSRHGTAAIASPSRTSPENTQQFYAEYALPADLFARMVAFVISQPEEVDVNEILFGQRARNCKRPWPRTVGMAPRRTTAMTHIAIVEQLDGTSADIHQRSPRWRQACRTA